MPYDPSENPRSVAGEEIEAPVDEDRVASLEAEAAALREALDLFEHPGWAHIEATLEQQLQGLTALLLSPVESPIHIGTLRGQINALKSVLALPESCRSQLHTKVAELTGQEDSTESEL
jgi:hypothetical protein